MGFYLVCLLLGSAALYEAQAAGTSCNCGWINKGRIVGGSVTGRNKWPMMVSLEHESNSQQFCGATILTQWHVVTAAHCTHERYAPFMQVRVGAHELKTSGKVYELAKVINHEKFQPNTGAFDISLLVTMTPIEFNQEIGPACLPSGRTSLVGQKLTALGWGNTAYRGQSSDVLREVQLGVININDCKKAWVGHPTGAMPRDDNNLCTFEKGKDTCQKDSGGPLLWLDKSVNRYTLAGIVSYGGVCGGPHPGVWTDVSLFLDWINSHIQATKPGISACRKV